MTVTTSRFGLVIDHLVALLNASPTFADPVFVADGPANVPDGQVDTVYVGFTGDWETPVEHISIQHGPYYIGNTSVTEDLTINCEIITWTGDSVAKTVRDRAIVLFAGVEAVIRTDPTLGIDGSTLAELTPVAVFQDTFENGLGCRLLFSVHVITKLLTA